MASHSTFLGATGGDKGEQEMPKQKRIKTSYPGVYYIIGHGARGEERIYYISYRRSGKKIEEKAGRQFQDDMTPARAAGIRAKRIEGAEPSNVTRRGEEKIAKEAEAGKWSIDRLWGLYQKNLEGLKSQAADKSRFTSYLQPFFGTKEPHEIVPLDIDRLRRKALSGKSDQTVKHVLALLRRIVRYGIRKRLSQGLTFTLEMPKVDNEVVEMLTKQELSRLLKVLQKSDDIQISHLMLLALLTGMRKGELLRLCWGDVDLENGFVTIRAPKGGRTARIPINNAARRILKDHPRIADQVFCNHKREPFRDIRKRVDVIRKAAGLPKGFRPLHGLRHVYASVLASSGQVDLYTLQRLLTHKSQQMTARYSHIRDAALRKASEVAASIFDEAIGDE